MARNTALVPLGRDASSRFLPWIFALMVYLACLALAGVLVMYSASERWNQGQLDNLTVQVLPRGDGSDETRVESVVALLAETPGISSVRAVADEESRALLEPWLDDANLIEGVVLPRLIEARIAEPDLVDWAALRSGLAAHPDVLLDDPEPWLGQLVMLGRSLASIASVIVLLIAFAAVATVVFTTRIGLALHFDVIELLHLIGAKDRYVAKLFERHAFRLGLRGSLPAAALAAGTLIGVQYAASRWDSPLFPNLQIDPWIWGAIGAVPFIAALIAMVTARRTAMRALTRLP